MKNFIEKHSSDFWKRKRVPHFYTFRFATSPCAGACRHAGCETKASRHAVTPQLRPQDKVSLPVASSAPSRGRDETNFSLSVPPARRAGRRHRQNRITNAALCWKIGSLSLKWKSHERAQVRTCFVESARVAPSRPVREAPYRSKRKTKFARSDKSTLCDIKLAAVEKATGGPGTGDPARPRAGHFMITQCVLILRAREHRPRRRAPGRPHSAVE